MLEHILWHISGNEEMGRFLQNLTSNDSATCLDISREKKDIIKDAMEHLVKWKQQRFDENPIALLSLLLSRRLDVALWIDHFLTGKPCM